MSNNIKEFAGISGLLYMLFKKKILKYNNKRITTTHNKFKDDCLGLLPKIKNIPIKDFSIDSYYETILVDTRKLEHIEFLLRNIINRFDSYWSHTVVTGLDNYDYMNEMCSLISSRIKVIKLNVKNLDFLSYNNYLGSKEFWEMFKGEKLFLWSEDTIIYKNNISDFLKYDFIGAPFPIKWGYPEGFSNGHVTLRTKSILLKCLDKVKFNKNVTKGQRGKMNLEKPEDIYFSETIYKYKLGKLPDRDIQLKFCIKDVYTDDPFCGHYIWNKNIIMNDRKNKFKNLLRSGYFNFLNNPRETHLLK